MQSTVAVDGFLNHLQLERHPKFPLFPTLPNELQHMVWKEATRDDGYGEYKRMVEIRYEAANLRPYTRSVIPDGIKVLLSTCRASNKAYVPFPYGNFPLLERSLTGHLLLYILLSPLVTIPGELTQY